MNISVIQETVKRSLSGTITFPEVVGMLLEEGVESYHVDLVRAENRYYMPNGETHVEPVPFAHSKPGQKFSAAQVDAAVRAIQAGKINYQEFLHKILEAGTAYYIVYLSGKKAIYFGRDGDFHIEPFPQPK